MTKKPKSVSPAYPGKQSVNHPPPAPRPGSAITVNVPKK